MIIRPALLAFLVWLLIAHAPIAQTAPETDEEKLGYTIGVHIGRDLLNQALVLDRDSLIQGLKDALAEGDLQLSDKQMRQILVDHRRTEQDKQKQAASDNEEQGRAFLAANKHKDGVETHPSELQYKVIRVGSGDSPSADDTVTVHYEGRLLDGKVFDSSYQRGEPVTLSLDRVIKGWRIALPLMTVGAKWRLFIPSELGYGAQGAGPDIEPNSTLIFDVELVSIE